jgi:hypothetical protein
MSYGKLHQRFCPRCDEIFWTTAQAPEACEDCNKKLNPPIRMDNGFFGFKKCPGWLKVKLIEAANAKCQECKKTGDLEIHRILRGNQGGLYTVVPLGSKYCNCKVVCKKCHKKFHRSENGCRNK